MQQAEILPCTANILLTDADDTDGSCHETLDHNFKL